MKKRPSSVAVIGWAFIALGCITFIAGVLPLFGVGTSGTSAGMGSHELIDLALVLITRALAVVGGVFVLLGYNWARWLLIVWTAFHVVISIQGPAFEIIVHSLIFIAVLYLLLRPESTAFFRRTSVDTDSID